MSEKLPKQSDQSVKARIAELLSLDWGKHLSGKLVDFGEPGSKEGLAWGIELTFPLTTLMRKSLGRFGIDIPNRITRIRFLDLDPEESRNKSKYSYSPHKETALFRLVNIMESPTSLLPWSSIVGPRVRNTILTFFKTMFYVDKKAKIKFNNVLENSHGSEIVLVQGHSDARTIGSRDGHVEETRDPDGNVIQRKDNEVDILEVLDRYNDENMFGAILVKACEAGIHEEKFISWEGVPLVLPQTYISIATQLSYLFFPNPKLLIIS